jgi:hypothetical protein
MSALMEGSFQFMYWSVGMLASCGYVCIVTCGSAPGARRLRVDIRAVCLCVGLCRFCEFASVSQTIQPDDLFSRNPYQPCLSLPRSPVLPMREQPSTDAQAVNGVPDAAVEPRLCTRSFQLVVSLLQ